MNVFIGEAQCSSPASDNDVWVSNGVKSCAGDLYSVVLSVVRDFDTNKSIDMSTIDMAKRALDKVRTCSDS